MNPLTFKAIGVKQFHKEDLALAREMKDYEGVAISLGNVGKVHAHLQERQQSADCFAEISKLAFHCKSRSMLIDGTSKQATTYLSAQQAGKEHQELAKEAVRMLERVRVLRSGQEVHIRHWTDASKSILLPLAPPDNELNSPIHLQLLGLAYVSTRTRKGVARGLRIYEEAFEKFVKLDDVSSQISILLKKAQALWICPETHNKQKALDTMQQVADLTWRTHCDQTHDFLNVLHTLAVWN